MRTPGIVIVVSGASGRQRVNPGFVLRRQARILLRQFLIGDASIGRRRERLAADARFRAYGLSAVLFVAVYCALAARVKAIDAAMAVGLARKWSGVGLIHFCILHFLVLPEFKVVSIGIQTRFADGLASDSTNGMIGAAWLANGRAAFNADD